MSKGRDGGVREIESPGGEISRAKSLEILTGDLSLGYFVSDNVSWARKIKG